MTKSLLHFGAIVLLSFCVGGNIGIAMHDTSWGFASGLIAYYIGWLQHTWND